MCGDDNAPHKKVNGVRWKVKRGTRVYLEGMEIAVFAGEIALNQAILKPLGDG
jgi:hypothetical protein